MIQNQALFANPTTNIQVSIDSALIIGKRLANFGRGISPPFPLLGYRASQRRNSHTSIIVLQAIAAMPSDCPRSV